MLVQCTCLGADDLHSDSGLNGDQFLNAIQPITQAIPYMVAVGNHEDKYNFTHYLNRFTAAKAGAGVESGSNTNLWYSFNIDNVHFVAIDTELADDTLVPAQMERQLNWLEADLIAANLNVRVGVSARFGCAYQGAWACSAMSSPGLSCLATRLGG